MELGLKPLAYTGYGVSLNVITTAGDGAGVAITCPIVEIGELKIPPSLGHEGPLARLRRRQMARNRAAKARTEDVCRIIN